MSSNTRPWRRLRLPAHATVVAYLALFLVMSTGGAYAASKIGGNAIKNNAIQSRHIKDGQVRNADLHENSVGPAKVKDDSLTGADINESTLGQVPIASTATAASNAANLGGKAPSAFASSTVYKRESAVNAGTRLGDATNVKSQSCDPGDILLSGGPANVNASSKLLESFPSPGTTNGWSARIKDGGTVDNFSVVVLCLDQTP